MVETFTLIDYYLTREIIPVQSCKTACVYKTPLANPVTYINCVYVPDRQIISFHLCSHCSSMPLQCICSYHAIAIFMYISVIHVLWLITYGYIAST